MKYISTINGNEYSIEIVDEQCIIVNNRSLTVDFNSIGGQPIYSLLVGGKSYEGLVSPGEDEWEVILVGRQYPVIVEEERRKRLRMTTGEALTKATEFHLRAPMPGVVVAIPVNEGQTVEEGQVLIILESMKMENELKATRGGIVSRLSVKVGESVEQRQTLLSIQ